MGRYIRWHQESFVHFVTNRTEHELFLLLPKKEVNDLILYWLTKAKAKKGPNIQLYAFVFLSNHHHMLLQDPKGELAEFMGYFQGNLAKALNRLHDRKGKFWSREYDDVIVDGEDEFWERYGYVAANPVKAGLVAKPDMWKGVSSVHYINNASTVTGTGLNATKYGNASRHGKKADKKEHMETFSFSLAIPPMLKGLSAMATKDYLSDLNAQSGRNARSKRGAKPSLGMDNVLKQHPFDRPKSSAHSPRFKFMSFCEERKKALKDKYKWFVSAYRTCCQSLIVYFDSAPCVEENTLDEHEKKIIRYSARAPEIIWPSGCYVPTTHKPITA